MSGALQNSMFFLTAEITYCIISVKSIPIHTQKGETTDGAAQRKICRNCPGRRKGQIVIPKGVRELFDIRPGDTLLVLADKKQGIVITKDDMLFQQFDAIVKGEDPT